MTTHRVLLVVTCMALLACGGNPASPSTIPETTAQASAIPAATADASIAAAASSSVAIVLHETPADLGCDSIGVDYTSMTFQIDQGAPEPVSALTDTGVSLVTYWPAEFSAARTADNPFGPEFFIRDSAGVSVATDGDTLKAGETLHGYYVCLSPSKLYVMLVAPSG
jgi:hypothetical protein